MALGAWKVALAVVCAFILVVGEVGALPPQVNIGGLFENAREDEIRSAFTRAVSVINEERSDGQFEIVANPTSVAMYDSFMTGRTVCELMSTGMAAIFGPTSVATSGHVQALCDMLEVPNVQAHFNPYLNRSSCSISVYPHHSTLGRILANIVDAYEWKGFTILYEDDESLIRVSQLLEKYDPKGYTVTLRQLPREDMKPIFREIIEKKVKNIVIDCSLDLLREALRQAQQVNVMGSGFNYLITNLDFHTLDLDPYRYTGTNMTGLRIIQPDNPLVRSTIAQWAAAASLTEEAFTVEPGTLQLAPALMWDAVHLFSRAIEHLDESRQVNEMPGLQCEEQTSWEHGLSLLNIMRTTEIEGLTGTIRFDHQGFRTDYSLDIIELSTVGESTQAIGNVGINSFNLTRVEKEKENFRKELETVRNQTFKVMIALSEPYNMLQDSPVQLSGNDRYEGFCIDLIKELSLMLGFNYTFIHQQDNLYGSCDRVTEQCDGMLGKVQNNEADLAITDLTITYDRAAGVDFTKPFMNLGIALLHTTPSKLQPSLWSFLDPFSGEVWMYLLAAYVIVSLQLYFMARITPGEWTNPYPCIEEPEELENQFSLANAFWFTIGAIMQQGSEIAPIAPSTRMAAGMWWFFALIMVSSYTANLAAFLTVEPTQEIISDPKQLADHPRVKYGAKHSGSTIKFFTESTDPIFQKMAHNMVNMKENIDGVRRVIESGGDYAYFMESSSIEYQAQRECSVRKVGLNLDEKGYGIAMRKNAPYLTALSAAVVKLQESGKLSELRTRWWEQRRGGGKCSGKAEENTADELGLANVGGVFVVLGVGVGIAVIVAVAELLWDLAVKAHAGEVSFKSQLWEEIKFFIKCSGSTKPVTKAKTDEEKLEDALKDFQPLSPYAVGYEGPSGSNGKTTLNAQSSQNQKETLY